jgi:uncharacterized protein YjgD (DUF1641 family)
VDNSLNLSIGLLTPKPILELFKSILEMVIIGGKIARNSTYKATPNYNSNTIIVNIGEVSSEIGNLGLYKHTRLT